MKLEYLLMKKKMNQGLSAPKINGKIVLKKIIDKDMLEIFKPF